MKPAIRNLIGGLSLVLMLGAIYMIFEVVPNDADSGLVQRIFYFHVSLAWVAFAAFGIVAISGALYLWLEHRIWDDLGRAGAETGMLFCTLMLVTGSLWARPIWGTWWTWDSRLTTTFILWLMYGGYLILRASAEDSRQAARLCAVVGIVAVLDVPIVIVSVRLWRTIHPAVLLTRQGSHGIEDPRMIAALLISLGAVTAFFAWILMLRFAELRVRSRIESLGAEVSLAEARAGDA